VDAIDARIDSRVIDAVTRDAVTTEWAVRVRETDE